MNKLILFILFSISIISVFAQNDDEPTPYALKPQYRDVIRYKELPANFSLPYYNHDSLYRVYNKNTPNDSEGHVGGFGLHFQKPLSMQNDATKIEIDCGTVYIFKLTGPTADGLGLSFDSIRIAPEMQLSYIAGELEEGYFEVHSNENNLLKYVPKTGAKELYIELFIPKNCKKEYLCTLKTWGYTFAWVKKKIRN